MNRKKGDGALCTHSLAPLESAHTKTTYTHTHTRNLVTEHAIVRMAARVSPARPAGNTRKATRLIVRRTSKPEGATHLATQCGMLLPVFRALVFGLALCFEESINLT
jgi:hypothetical protein